MRTQDLKYIVTKRTQEHKKIEKIQSQLHLTSVDHNIKNNHIYFDNGEVKTETEKARLAKLSETELPDIDPEALQVHFKVQFRT